MKIIDDRSPGFHGFMRIVGMKLYALAFFMHVYIPVAGILAIKDLPCEIKSQKFCTAAYKGSWACLWVDLTTIALLIMRANTPPGRGDVLTLVFVFFLTLGVFANLTQILINIFLYRKYRHRLLADASKTQAFMILTLVFSIVLMLQISAH